MITREGASVLTQRAEVDYNVDSEEFNLRDWQLGIAITLSNPDDPAQSILSLDQRYGVFEAYQLSLAHDHTEHSRRLSDGISQMYL